MESAMAHLAASGPCCGRNSKRVPLMACCMKRTAMRKPKSSPLKRVNLQAARAMRARQISPESMLPKDPIRAAHAAAPAVQRRMQMQRTGRSMDNLSLTRERQRRRICQRAQHRCLHCILVFRVCGRGMPGYIAADVANGEQEDHGGCPDADPSCPGEKQLWTQLALTCSMSGKLSERDALGTCEPSVGRRAHP